MGAISPRRTRPSSAPAAEPRLPRSGLRVGRARAERDVVRSGLREQLLPVAVLGAVAAAAPAVGAGPRRRPPGQLHGRDARLLGRLQRARRRLRSGRPDDSRRPARGYENGARRHGVRRDGRAARAARLRDARRLVRPQRRRRDHGRRDAAGRRRHPRALGLPAAARPPQRATAARPAGRPARRRRRARRLGARLAEPPAAGACAQQPGRARAARCRSRRLRADRAARPAHVPAHAARARPRRSSSGSSGSRPRSSRR